MLDAFEACGARTPIAAAMALVSNVTGRLAGDESATPAYWRRHVREAGALRRLDRDAAATTATELFVEVGPGARRCSAWRSAADRAGGSRWIALAAQGPRRRAGDARKPRPAARARRAGELAGADRSGEARSGVTRRCRAIRSSASAIGTICRIARRATRAASAGARNIRCSAARWRARCRSSRTRSALAAQPWLADHRIFDFTLFPAAGFLELALAAAREVLGSDQLVLRELAIGEALRLPEQGNATVQVDRDAGRRRHAARAGVQPRATVASATAWRLHASAACLRVADARQCRAALRCRCAARERRPIARRRRVLRASREPGRAVRPGVPRHRADGGRATARCSAACSCRPRRAARRHVAHPALLDACYPVGRRGVARSRRRRQRRCLSCRSASTRTACLVAASRPPGAMCDCTEADAKAPVLRADLTLFDDDGVVVAEVGGHGTAARHARCAAARRRHAGARTESLFEVDWQASQHDAAARSAAGTLARALPTHGGSASRSPRACVRMAPASLWSIAAMTSACATTAWQIDAADPAQYRRAARRRAPRRRPAAERHRLPVVARCSGGRPQDVDFDRSRPCARAARARSRLAQALTDVQARLWFVTRGAQAVAGSAARSRAGAGVGAGRRRRFARCRRCAACASTSIAKARDDDAERLFDAVCASRRRRPHRIARRPAATSRGWCPAYAGAGRRRRAGAAARDQPSAARWRT